MLPFLLVHGLAIWIALAALTLAIGAWRGWAGPRRRLTAEWRGALERLATPAPEQNWSPGQDVTISGTLADPLTRTDGEHARLRTAGGTEVALRAPIALRYGSSITAAAEPIHRVAAGEPIRVRGRLHHVSGTAETGFRESAHGWELCAPISDPADDSIPAVAERRPVLRPIGLRSIALRSLLALSLFAVASSAASGLAYTQIQEHLSILPTYPWHFAERHEPRAWASVAAASPLFRDRVLARLGFELRIHDSSGREVVEASVQAYTLAGECAEASRAALARAEPELALAATECAPSPAHLRATALHELGRFAEASDLFATIHDRAIQIEAAEVHLLAGQLDRAQRALVAWSKSATPDEALPAAQVADAILARRGDRPARERLLGSGPRRRELGLLLLADAESGADRLATLARMSTDRDREPLRTEVAWVTGMLEVEASGSIRDGEFRHGCPESMGSRTFLVDGDDLDRRTDMMDGLALAVARAPRSALPTDGPTRMELACAALVAAEYHASVWRIDEAAALLDLSNQVAPTDRVIWRVQDRQLRLAAGLAYHRGDLAAATALIDKMLALDPPEADTTLVQAISFARKPHSAAGLDRLFRGLEEPLLSAALAGDGRDLAPLMVEIDMGVPSWLYALAPRLEKGRERLLDMALHRSTLLVRTQRGAASARYQLAAALGSPELARRWKQVLDRHVQAELRRDTAVLLGVLRAELGHRLERTWIFD